jgi:hypothetical protein
LSPTIFLCPRAMAAGALALRAMAARAVKRFRRKNMKGASI